MMRFAMAVLILLAGAGKVIAEENEGAFFQAVSRGDVNAVSQMIQARPQLLMAKDANGLLALHDAAWAGQDKMVETLAVPDANINEPAMGQSPLEFAIRGNHPKTVELLLERGADPNGKGTHGDNPIVLAATTGNTAIAQELIARGARPNQPGVYGRTALQEAASRGNYKMAQLLLAHGANPNAADTLYDETPLHAAAKFRQSMVVELLLDHGANPNAKMAGGLTPLHVAAKSNDQVSVRLLLARGALINAHDNHGLTAVDLTRSRTMEGLLNSYGASSGIKYRLGEMN